MTMKIGCHLSVSKGFAAMAEEALLIGANTFQFFTRNPRGGKAKAIDEKDVEAFLKIAKENQFAQVLAHAPYTLNICSADSGIREFSKNILKDDLARMEYIPGNLYNFHPGSHVGQGLQTGVQIIAEALNEALTPDQNTTVLLETMAGKGSEIGGTFEEIESILEKVELSEKVGVCLDTCHVHDGGYDIIEDIDGVLEHFDKIIGLDKLRAIHLNDSLNQGGSHKDRHAKIGEGEIGLEAICRIINHPKLSGLPFLLETPNDIKGYEQEIRLLKSRWTGNEK